MSSWLKVTRAAVDLHSRLRGERPGSTWRTNAESASLASIAVIQARLERDGLVDHVPAGADIEARSREHPTSKTRNPY